MTSSWERVVGPQLLTGAIVKIYTVPTGKKLVIRSIEAVSTSAGNETLTLGIGNVSNTDNIVKVVVPASTGVLLNDLRIVMYAGETLWGQTSATNQQNVTVNGFLVDV